jgi:MFS family permease
MIFDWWREGTPAGKRALVAAALGWMLDSFDVMLYALVLPALMTSLSIDPVVGGRIQSFTLIAAAAGGLAFGVIADRFGRTRALMASVLIYSVFTALCGFAQSAAELAVFRICLGIGMGGEWASGAALVSESWPERHRGKALAWMQSAWAIGYALATLPPFLEEQRAKGKLIGIGISTAGFNQLLRGQIECGLMRSSLTTIDLDGPGGAAPRRRDRRRWFR